MPKKASKGPKKTAKAKSEPKSAQIVSMLRRQSGASIPELIRATGWQAHSLRGFISGMLKGKQWLAVTSTAAAGKDRRYMIVEAT